MASTLEGGPHNAYELEFLFSSQSRLRFPPENLGETPEGIRLNFYREGGEIVGPRLRGHFQPVGGDWLLVRPDGVGMVDVRGTIESDDGALIYQTYTGVIDFGPNGLEQLRAGELPAVNLSRIVPRFLTSHPDYLWLNRVQAIGIGESRPDLGGTLYDVYQIR